MTPSPGDRLGHYEIIAPLGAGGMGEVYRARDTRLDREVAVKVLPEEVATDPERLARFEREARVLGSLNHPNIATLHGLDTVEPDENSKLKTENSKLTSDAETSEVTFLVMELVEGEDLARRIARGPLCVKETIETGRQIADGLEAAHSAGIVHRDLKPANIRITPDGTVKILDFGLAKEWGPAPGNVDYTASPTITADMTMAGTVLGTAPYLSPEQARGKPLDRRTDIWALGCVLYEMLTGRRAFPGNSSTEILAQILEREPDWSSLPPTVSPALRRLVERCLEKKPKRRLRDAGDVALALEDLEAEAPLSSPGMPRSSGMGLKIALGLVSLAAALLAILLWIGHSPGDGFGNTDPLRFTEISSAELDIARVGHMGSAVAISPDGHVLIWVGIMGDSTKLFSRHLDEPEAQPVPGTDGALAPFFSPDGEWIGFWADNKLQKVDLRGGAPQTICVADHIHGASWGDGFIVMELGGGGNLASVDLASGKIELLPVSPEIGFLPSFPKLLPGSKTAIVSSLSVNQVGLWDIESGEITPLLEEANHATYVPTGHLLWISGDSLLAAPFDVASLELTGDAHTVIQGVLTEPGFASHHATSDEGTLVYLPGTPSSGALQPSWLRLDGSSEALPVPTKHSILSPRISPDGRKVLLSLTGEFQGLVVVDLERDTINPISSDQGNRYWAIWTPDNRHIISNLLRGPELDLWITPSNLSKPPRKLTTTPGQLHVPMEITPDGLTVLVGVTDSINHPISIHILDLDGDGTTRPLLTADASVTQPNISPDGGLLAYASDHTGGFEIYLQSFPDLGATIRVSRNGGQEPLWSPSGERIYYRSLNGNQIFATDILDRATLRLGKEILLVEGDFAPGIRWGRKWDIHPDGDRFLVLKVVSSESPEGIRVVRNWFDELERLVPVTHPPP